MRPHPERRLRPRLHAVPPLGQHPLAEVRPSTRHGRGLFARRHLPLGTLIDRAPLLILSVPDTETILKTLAGGYVFWIDEDEHRRDRAAIAFGLISMCNHEAAPSARFRVDRELAMVDLIAGREHDEGDEITIDYEDFVHFDVK